MNTALEPEQFIPIPWEHYLSNTYDKSLIPWECYRWEDGGIVPVGSEVFRNVVVGQRLFRFILQWIAANRQDWFCIYDKLEVEVNYFKHRCRIPDLLVLSSETLEKMGDETHIITLDMAAPALVVEVISPSSKETDITEKETEYLHRGVGEYVSIDWRTETVIVRSRQQDGTYLHQTYSGSDRIQFASMPALELDVVTLVSGDRTC